MVGLGSGGEDRWEGLLRRRRWRRRRGEGDAEVGEAAVVEGRTGGAAKREDIGTVDSREVGEVGAEDVGIGTRDGEAEEVEIVAGRATEEVRVTVVGGVEEGAVRTTCVLCPSGGGSLGAKNLEAQGHITKNTRTHQTQAKLDTVPTYRQLPIGAIDSGRITFSVAPLSMVALGVNRPCASPTVH